MPVNVYRLWGSMISFHLTTISLVSNWVVWKPSVVQQSSRKAIMKTSGVTNPEACVFFDVNLKHPNGTQMCVGEVCWWAKLVGIVANPSPRNMRMDTLRIHGLDNGFPEETTTWTKLESNKPCNGLVEGNLTFNIIDQKMPCTGFRPKRCHTRTKNYFLLSFA